MFSAFGEDRLERVDNTTSPAKLAEWKTSERTKKAYKDLFANHDLLSRIGHNVFKSYKEKELPTMHCAYILAICDIVLNPRSSGIKCNDRSVIRRVNAFLVNIRNFPKLNYFLITEIFIILINRELSKVIVRLLNLSWKKLRKLKKKKLRTKKRSEDLYKQKEQKAM